MFCLIKNTKNNIEKFEPYTLYKNDEQLYLPRNINKYFKNDFILYEDRAFNSINVNDYNFISELREEQKDIINTIINEYNNNGFINGVIHVSTGGGKTFMSIQLAHYLRKKTLVIVDTNKIIEQQKEEIIKHTSLTNNDIGIIKGNIFDVENKTFIMTTPQTLASKVKNNLKDYYKKIRELGIDLIFFDECLSNDTEILTENGWQRFDNLDKNIKVAQYNKSTKDISFVYPDKYIENDYNGKLVNLKNKSIDILATPNHEQLYYNSYTNETKKIEIDRLSKNYYYKLLKKGNGTGNLEFTNFHKFLIMLQADGTIQYENKKSKKYQVSFSFVKERKIKRMIEITNSLNYEYKEVKCDGKKRRFLVYPENVNIYKNFYDWLNINNISKKFANDFINELSYWDGSRKELYKYGRLYYSTNNKLNADIVQIIATLSDYVHSRSIQVDNRKTSYKDIHRFYFYKDRQVSTQGIEKNYIEYNGKVYCVKVPEGNIIIRRNNKVCITGNCHKLGTKYASSSLFFNTKNLIGLSATPYLNNEQDILFRSLYNNTIVKCGIYHYQPIVKFIKYDSGLGKIYGKRISYLWNTNFIQARSIYNSKLTESQSQINKIYNIVDYEVKNNNKIIIICLTKAQLLFVYNYLKEKNIKSSKLFSEKNDIDKVNDNVIVATYKYASHAFDYAALNRLILATPLMGRKSLIQSIGRIVRLYGGKSDAIVYDLIDTDDGFNNIFIKSIKNKINILTNEFENCIFENS